MKVKTTNYQKIWHDSYLHERANALRGCGITDESEILKLANTDYILLPSDIRYKLETANKTDHTG